MEQAAGTPQLSVVVPARNAARFVGETLASLRGQTLAAFEAVVVDDGSTDATAEIVRRVAEADGRFGLIPGAASGVSAARNAGFAAARGGIVVFLDSDDLLAPDALERLVEALAAAPEAVAALGGVTRIAENGRPLPGRDNRDLARGADPLADLVCKNFIVNGGALAVRSAAVAATGGFDTSLAYGEDWEFWCRLLAIGPLAVVPGEPVLSYRQVASGGNFRARGSALARGVPCLERVATNPAMRARYGARLAKLIRARRIDIFWSGVRSEYQFGRSIRALALAAAGIALYPDSVARPGLAIRFLRSLAR